MKRCPKCRSTRVRRGYAYDPLIIRVLGFRELLCDSCNLRFRGFVIPGTLPRSSRNKKKLEQELKESAAKSGERRRPETSDAGRRRCPRCSSESTHRSHRRGVIENLTSVISYFPYRCDDCNNRYLARRN